MKVARSLGVFGLGMSVAAGIIAGCGEASSGTLTDNGDPPSCRGREVALQAECLECDAARSQIREQLLTKIADNGWDACATDADCLSQEWLTPCDGQCNVAISRDAQPAFGAALGSFVSSVCDAKRWQASCGSPRDVDCRVDAHCIAGACTIGGVSCGDRAEDECASDGRCGAVRAYPYDAAGACFSGDTVFVGCRSLEVSCRPIISAGLDADGNCFAFGDCLASGFEPAPADHPCEAALATTCGLESSAP